MSNIATGRERLTWAPVHPAPFESIWSICHKVIAFNHISLNELLELIRKDGTNHYSWLDTNWIDFERFGSLLRIDPKRLTGGTWQAMDMKPVCKADYRFRRCPECWARGYHCVLFDLAWIEKCPWHRCYLTAGCEGCGSIKSFSRRTIYNTHVVLKRFCERCGIIFPEYRKLLDMEPFTQNESSMIIGYCIELIEWWKTLGRRFTYRDELLSNLLWVSKIDRKMDFRALVWPLSFARELMSDVDLFWDFGFDSTPVHLAIIDQSDEEVTKRSHNRERGIQRIGNEAGKCYRSLRRHIYKKFVSDHCQCCTELRRLNRQQAMALNGSEVCTVGLAYLVWRMSIEGLCHLEGLHFPRKDDFDIKLMGPSYLDRLSLANQLRWSYFAFLGLLHELGKVNGQYKIRVMAGDFVYEGDLHWCSGKNDQSEGEDAARNDYKRLLVLYPEVETRLLDQKQWCRERWKRKRVLVDEEQINKDLYWERCRQETFNQRLCIVQTRHNDPDGRRLFWHINV